MALFKLCGTLTALLCLSLGASRVSAGYAADWRYIRNGRLMYETGYMDQPYCVVDTQHKDNTSALSRWVCCVTLNNNTEGKPGEHIAGFYSEDQGRSWTGPNLVHPDLLAEHIDTSYSTIAQAHSGRIYIICDANLNNVTQLPSGKPISRTDEFGFFIMSWSDDGGKTFSKERFTLPSRTTAIDRNNDWGGKVKEFWNVDQMKLRNDTVYFMYTKIGRYLQEPPEEGFIVASSNLMTEVDPSKVTFQLLPSGDHGPGSPAGYDPATTVAEEWHVLPLAETPGFFAVFRTNVGLLGAAHTADPTGASGWGNSTYASFDAEALPNSPAEASLALKNPRGPITLKRFSNGNYLMLWYNNHCNSFASTGGRSSRNPYWLSAARETSDGRIVFSQPEIVLYGVAAGDQRPGYPDFIEDVDGSIWISETQKTATRVHALPPDFLAMLWSQHNASTPAAAGVVLDVQAPPKGHAATLPASAFEDLRKNDSSPGAPALVQWPGFAIDLWVEGHGASADGQQLFFTKDASGTGGSVAVAVTSAHRNLTLSISDGSTTFNVSTDDACTQALAASGSHYVALNVDGGAAIGSVMVDGKLCDGSTRANWGFFQIARTFGAPGAGTSATLAGSYAGTLHRVRLYNRPLFTSEMVGNYRAGASAAAAAEEK